MVFFVTYAAALCLLGLRRLLCGPFRFARWCACCNRGPRIERSLSDRTLSSVMPGNADERPTPRQWSPFRASLRAPPIPPDSAPILHDTSDFGDVVPFVVEVDSERPSAAQATAQQRLVQALPEPGGTDSAESSDMSPGAARQAGRVRLSSEADAHSRPETGSPLALLSLTRGEDVSPTSQPGSHPLPPQWVSTSPTANNHHISPRSGRSGSRKGSGLVFFNQDGEHRPPRASKRANTPLMVQSASNLSSFSQKEESSVDLA